MNEEVIDILESIRNTIDIYLWLQKSDAPDDVKTKGITLLEDLAEKIQVLALEHCVRPDISEAR
jgi:hypothetical protein